MFRLSILPIVVLCAAATMTPVGRADPLNPLDFPSLGAVTLTAGSYTIDTGATPPTISGPMNFAGTVYGSGASGIAVFSFDSLTIPAGLTITVTGNRMLALLSAGDMNVASAISVNGGAAPAPVSPGVGLGGVSVAGTGAGGAGGGRPASNLSVYGGWGNGSGGGGGGFATASSPTNGSGGPTYGSLLRCLQSGSGGGGGTSGNSGAGGGGGAGGGAIELGALGALNLSAAISANGGAGRTVAEAGGGGGGSGGAILLHAATLVLPPSMTANGGAGGIGSVTIGTQPGQGGGGGFGGIGQTSNPGGQAGGGGGGRVVLQSANSVSTSGISVAGGAGWLGTGGAGVILAAHVSAVATDLDFGNVSVGSSKTLGMLLQSTGDADTSINGQFPDSTGAPFARAGNAVFSGLKPGKYAAAPYTFSPTAAGPFSQMLTIVSDAGPIQVTLTGVGVSSCPGDIDGNGVVDLSDLAIELSVYGTLCP